MLASPDHFFVGNACQYYAAARFAVHAGCIPVCGNLFHHAVEMLLKGGLAKKTEAIALRVEEESAQAQSVVAGI